VKTTLATIALILASTIATAADCRTPTAERAAVSVPCQSSAKPVVPYRKGAPSGRSFANPSLAVRHTRLAVRSGNR
jgi:hypothetical protein